MARLIDIASNAAASGFGSERAAQGWWAVTPTSPLGDPQQWTETSACERSSRARYSTWTPAPPYTSGGYSRVSSATLWIKLRRDYIDHALPPHLVEDHQNGWNKIAER